MRKIFSKGKIFVLGIITGGVLMYTLMLPVASPEDITRLKIFTQNVLPEESVLYKNDKYGFSLHYPQGLIFKEFDEGAGAQTIVFQKPNDVKTGFQIYITPYTEATITGQRILFDVSGAVSDLKEENIRDDFLVATFISEASILGKTREIWWLHGGFLFELTTFASLDGWIRDIVKTVEFSKAR